MNRNITYFPVSDVIDQSIAPIDNYTFRLFKGLDVCFRGTEWSALSSVENVAQTMLPDYGSILDQLFVWDRQFANDLSSDNVIYAPGSHDPRKKPSEPTLFHSAFHINLQCYTNSRPSLRTLDDTDILNMAHEHIGKFLPVNLIARSKNAGVFCYPNMRHPRIANRLEVQLPDNKKLVIGNNRP